MGAIKRFGLFWYDFVIGDDWTMAVGVVAAIGLTWLLAKSFRLAWIVMPVAVVALLALSLGRAQRAARAAAGASGDPTA
jgi:hypothetical protein